MMNGEFISALRELEREKGVSFDVLLETIETALVTAYKKSFGPVQNARVKVDSETGEVKVFHQKLVTATVTDPQNEIMLEEARQIDPNYEMGDVVEAETTPANFGRIAAQTAKQVVVQRIREAERNMIYEQYAGREQDIVTGVVRRQEGRNIFIDLGRVEAVLPPAEQVHSERYQPGERLKAYVLEVRKTTKGPQITLSRSHPGLVKRLFEMEVPEIQDGLVEVKAIAREAGSRCKIAVASHDPDVDPVGACVGPRGMRVQTVVNELRGEKIDIVRWNADIGEFVSNALSPAKVMQVRLALDKNAATVIVPDHQLSLAIGKEGQNARLAAKVTGWKIDIKSVSQIKELEAGEQGHGDEEDTSTDVHSMPGPEG